MLRNYALRFNPTGWKIKCFARHACTSRCETIVIPTGDNSFQEIPNPSFHDGKCDQSNVLEPAFIRLCRFTERNPVTLRGMLDRPDMYVIPENHISVVVNFPLAREQTIQIKTRDPAGFTIAKLLYRVRKVYEYVYNEEERTSTEMDYHLSRPCGTCMDINPADAMIDETNEVPDEDCTICYEKLAQSPSGRLRCGHRFHRKCLEGWTCYSENCPLCRDSIEGETCTTCQNTRVEYYTFRGKVVPLAQRGRFEWRNETNGRFGIRLYDFENLFVMGMAYERRTRKLFLTMFGALEGVMS